MRGHVAPDGPFRTCTEYPSLDNLTHGLVGAALAAAGPRPAHPLATPTLVLAANAPDIDVLAYASGPYFALAFRRGITHGWPAMLLLPLVVTAVMVGWDRAVRRRREPRVPPARVGSLLALAAVGVATHPLLDWMNSYGMRWGLPFDGTWTYGDALFIIDPWIWLALGGALYLVRRRGPATRLLWGLVALLTTTIVLLAPVSGSVRAVWLLGVAAVLMVDLFGRRGGARAVETRTTLHGPSAPRVAVALVTAYVAAALVADRAARVDVRRASHDAGLVVTDLMVQPLPGTPFSGEVEVSTPAGYVPGSHRWLARPRVVLHPDRMVPRVGAPPELDEQETQMILRRARARPRVRDYLVWSRYPFATIERTGSSWRVRFSDARYDDRRGTGSLSGVEVVVPRGRELETERGRP